MEAINKENIETVTIKYTGNVSIQKIDSITGKAEKVTQKHNTGFVPFFDLIAQCIAGVDTTSLMPKYIKGFNASAFSSSTITGFISYNNPVVSKTLTTASVKLEFLVPFTQLSSSEFTNYLRLYNLASESAPVFAEVDISSPSLRIKGDGKTNYLITWTITIGNA
jgi:hypothetical protein